MSDPHALAVFRNCDRRSLPFFALGTEPSGIMVAQAQQQSLHSKKIGFGSFVAGCGISGASK
jgi:hypothetical protein